MKYDDIGYGNVDHDSIDETLTNEHVQYDWRSFEIQRTWVRQV